jgi:predicted flap endonuclease-1-like 5' DNA nuclease
MKLKVLDLMGVSLPGHGSRQAGETFDLPDDVAQQYAQDYPDRFTLESGVIEPSLADIQGIGPETATALHAAGITSLKQLTATDAADLAKRLDGSNTRQVRDWQRQAAALLKE